MKIMKVKDLRETKGRGKEGSSLRLLMDDRLKGKKKKESTFLHLYLVQIFV